MSILSDLGLLPAKNPTTELRLLLYESSLASSCERNDTRPVGYVDAPGFASEVAQIRFEWCVSLNSTFWLTCLRLAREVLLILRALNGKCISRTENGNIYFKYVHEYAYGECSRMRRK